MCLFILLHAHPFKNRNVHIWVMFDFSYVGRWLIIKRTMFHISYPKRRLQDFIISLPFYHPITFSNQGEPLLTSSCNYYFIYPKPTTRGMYNAYMKNPIHPTSLKIGTSYVGSYALLPNTSLLILNHRLFSNEHIEEH